MLNLESEAVELIMTVQESVIWKLKHEEKALQISSF